MDLCEISEGGQVMMILWMLIGGSPGSTAGGMKTTTIAILLLTSVAVFKRRGQVESHGRRISDETIHSTIAVFMIYMILFFIGGMVISRAEKLPLLTCLFETASALGTVGLSLGITSNLGFFSRTLLIIMMFLGRVGGLTLVYAAQSVRHSSCSIRPLEKVAVG